MFFALFTLFSFMVLLGFYFPGCYLMWKQYVKKHKVGTFCLFTWCIVLQEDSGGFISLMNMLVVCLEWTSILKQKPHDAVASAARQAHVTRNIPDFPDPLTDMPIFRVGFDQVG